MNNKEKMNLVLSVLKKYNRDNWTTKKNKFRILITTILSQRTRDENTAIVSSRLFAVANTPKQMLSLPTSRLQRIIKPIGFYREKSKKIKETCKMLLEKYNGFVPRSRELLLTLPGVGFKTADIVLSYGYNIPTIAVDVHVEVCSKRLGLARKNAKYEEIRTSLEKLVPPRRRHIVNHGFVSFGKDVCRTRNPRCDICPLYKVCKYEKKRDFKLLYSAQNKN